MALSNGPVARALLAGAVVLGLASCGSASDDTVAREASQLRTQAARFLRSEPRRALLYAVASQHLDPTSAGTWRLAEADQQFSGVAKVLPLSGASTVAAVRLITGIVTTTSSPSLQTWSAGNGALRGTTKLRRPITTLAASSSPYLIASADSAGSFSLWDTEHLGHPVQRTLPRVPASGRVIALGFVAASTRLLAVTSTGELIEYDALRHNLIAMRSLSTIAGLLRGRRHLSVSAGLITTQQYSTTTTVLLAVRGVGVIGVNPIRLGERLEIPAREISGNVSALAISPSETHTTYLATSDGTASWTGHGSGVQNEATGNSDGLALQGSTLFAANEQGLDSINLAEPGSGGRLSHYTGRPVRELIPGPGGALAIDRDGSISLLDEGESGINLKTTTGEAGYIANFGPEGNLLEPTGADASHVNELIALRPGLRGPTDPEYEPNRVVRRYTPATSWWPKEASERRGLFIDDVELTKRYALAGGQDPTGTAVLLVWNARTGKPLRRMALTVAGVGQEPSAPTTTPSLVSQVTELPKRHLIAVYSALQELIVLWSTQTWQRVMTIDVGPIGSFAANAEESTLLIDSLSDKQSQLDAGNAHTTLRFIDLDTGKTTHTVRSEGTTFAGFSEQGTIIEAAGGGVIRQLSSDGAHRVTKDINAESGEVVAWSLKAKSKVMAIASQSGEVRMLDLGTRTLSAALPSTPNSEALSLSFSPDGKLLAETDGRDEGNYHRLLAPSVWRVSDSALISRACTIAGGPPSRAQWTAWTGLRHSTRPCS
jgi:WD40 repeat protein